jgi:hypothetical protein
VHPEHAGVLRGRTSTGGNRRQSHSVSAAGRAPNGPRTVTTILPGDTDSPDHHATKPLRSDAGLAEKRWEVSGPTCSPEPSL